MADIKITQITRSPELTGPLKVLDTSDNSLSILKYPSNLALPLDIAVEASNGASDYGISHVSYVLYVYNIFLCIIGAYYLFVLIKIYENL
jgi:membrane-associated protease RseP (regulator of RpoE activity)